MKSLKRLILSMSALSFTHVQVAQAGGAAEAAQTAMQVATTVAATSAITGTSLVPKCSAPGGQAACVLMGLAFAQVGLSLLNKSGSKASKQSLIGGSGGNEGGSVGVNNIDPSGTYTTADGTVITGDDAKTANALTANGLGALSDDFAKGTQVVKRAGVEVSSDGQQVKLRNGKTIPSSAMSSPDGMKNAGFSNAEISNAESALSDLQKNAASIQSKVAALTNDVGGGGGGGGYGGAGGGGGSGGSGGDAGAYGRLGLANKSKANVSGMSKKFGNDNIGVAGDDIFEMVSRRYQSKDKVDSFLKN